MGRPSKAAVAAKQLKLVDLYQESQEERDQAALQLEVEQADLQLKADILATQTELSKAKQDYEDRLRERPFNSERIISAKNEVLALEAGLKDLNGLKKLF